MRFVVLALTLAGLLGCRPRADPHTELVQKVTAPSPHAALDLPRLDVVMSDPRLAFAKEREMARDWPGAARALDDVRSKAALEAPADCAWTYTSARLHLAASDYAEAAVLFDRASGKIAPNLTTCPLAGYATLRSAQAYEKAGRHEEAKTRALAVPNDLAASTDAELVLADALAAAGDRVSALALWQKALGRGAWVDVAMKIAVALLDGVDGDPTASARAEEALALATRVMVEVPKIADSSGATLARARAVALLKAKSPALTEELLDVDRARQARAWLDAGEASKAYALATSIKTLAKGEAACGLATTRAQAGARVIHGAGADLWGEAILACAGQDALVTALYNGGKASVAAKRKSEAIDRYAEVEKLFPAHRLADDARLRAALVLLDEGDEARFTSLLLALPDDYPTGDMRGEALFRVALLRMQKGDWKEAEPVLERLLALFPDDRHWATEGRAAYFRARASAALGDPADARARYAQIVQSCPLAYYMTQAYARLQADDAPFARRTLDEAVAREPEGTLFTAEHGELGTPAFQRALRLLEVGDIDAARREIVLSNAVAEGASAEVLWAIGLLYDQAGAVELGHAVTRGRTSDHLFHYPGGRWRAPWEAAFPRAYDPIVERESALRGIPTPLTWAIMREESDFYPEVKSAANAFGLMQLVVATARGVASGTGFGWNEDALKEPEVSIALGAKLLAGLRAQFAANHALAIAAYNGGSNAVNRWVAASGDIDFDLWVEQIPWDETRGYIKRVLASEAAYAFLYDRASLPEVLTLPRRALSRVSDAGGAD